MSTPGAPSPAERGRTLVVEGSGPLAGLVVAPPDKSITHRALLFAALGEGETEIAPLGGGRDNRATIGALRALGVELELRAGAGPASARVVGVGGARGLRAPAGAIDCMNSGTTMRLLAGVLAASGLRVELGGDASLTARPMTRLRPLERMGAKLSGRVEGGRLYPPLVVEGARLRGAEHVLPVASAQVKSALILAGLWAEGETTIAEPLRSRDHTERMLAGLGAPVVTGADGVIHVAPVARPWRAGRIEVAPDLSSAAFFLAAALITRSDALVVRTGTNPTRAGVLDVLERMGAKLARRRLPDLGGEVVEELTVEGSRSELVGTEIAGELALRAIDELPLLAGLAAFARGTTVIRDAAELRVKESDRLAAIHDVLTAFGARSTPSADGLTIEGSREALVAPEVDGRGDHRIAMTAAVMGLGVPGRTKVRGAEHVEVSFPGFGAELERLGARVTELVDEG